MAESSVDNELFHALRLNLVTGIGPRIQSTLCNYFGTAENVFAASMDEVQRIAGVGPKLARGIADGRNTSLAEQELENCKQQGVDLLSYGSDNYPRLLSEICDPPRVVYYRGSIEPRDELAIAIVGSRRCTLYGRQQAERLARALAKSGLTIVSGLARGIDAVAHRGALSAGGRTLAVMASGLSSIYPPEHEELSREVSANGAILSESHFHQEPKPGLFPQRNRIISGLSLGVIIVEASRKSGALHTARHAMEQGREVFAVPGRIDSLASEGCHDLIRDGVKLVRTPDDILEELGPLMQPVKTAENEEVYSPRELNLSDQERNVLNHLTSDPKHIDEVLTALELEPSRVLATLTVLEVKRMIRRLPGGYLVRNRY